jgi:glycosyltransferase involved in cell wall biosynthesis
MDKVNIILCTYNGEHFLEQQLNSVLAQTYANIDIYIRDDQSTDGTLEVIRRVMEKNTTGKRIFLMEDDQKLGYPECFISLLLKSDKADYYAFCDQDDVWYADKIEKGLRKIKNCKQSPDRPVLYYSAVDYYDAKLNFMRHSRFASTLKKDEKDLGLTEFLFGGEPLGMTYIFNEKVRQALQATHAAGYRDFKDGFIKVYAAAAGKVIYDREPSAQYRRHSGATTGNSNPDSRVKRYLAVFRELFGEKDPFASLREVMRVLHELFEDEILPENVQLIELFSEPNTLKKKFAKVFYRKRFRNVLLDEIAYRLLFLLGKS